MRNMRARALAFLTTVSLAAGLVIVQAPLPASASALCANPGSRQSGNISAIINTYFAATGTAAAGSTNITLSASVGANTAIAAEDLLMVIQMQDSAINATNSSSYGDGSTGAGSTDDQTTGFYEYVVAKNAVPTTGGTLTIAGTNAGGLINTYHTAAATATQGRATFQVIRVPQFSTATYANTGNAATPWNGTAGGVFAVDVTDALSTSTNITVDGDGFRGGAVQQMSGSGAAEPPAPQAKNGDYAVAQGTGYHGLKGEGSVGTPYAVYNGTTIVTGSETMPGGSFARGAPGNAGGGGSDADPAKNDQNTGGGGGAGAGSGGRGGNNWSPSSTGTAADNSGTENPSEGLWQTGGLGGKPITSLGVTRWTLGGGGGAGSNNDGTNGPTGSSGGPGGGVVMIRAGSVSGGNTISAAGTTGTAPVNDGGGGGGGGGTIFVTSTGTITGTTANATGAAGTSANATNGANNQDHGPGGGGGGGMIVMTGGLTTSVAAGANGITTTNNNAFGATSGTAGTVVTTTPPSIPGADSGAECTATGTTTFTIGPNGNSAASGSYDAAVTASNDNDFTATNIEPKNTSISMNANGTPATVNTQLVAATAPCIPHTVTIPSSKNYTVDAVAPSGMLVGMYTNATCTTLFGGSTVGATSSGLNASFPTGSTQFYTQYTTSGVVAITPFARYDGTLNIYRTPTPATSNITHDELYYGFVKIFKSSSVTTSTCASHVGLCPGSTVTYTITYQNMVTDPSSEAALVPIPYPVASGLVVSDDGTAINNWAANSNGLVAAPGDTTAATTYTYKKNGVVTGTAAAANQFSATVGGAGFTLVPTGISGASKGTSGTISFSVVIN